MNDKDKEYLIDRLCSITSFGRDYFSQYSSDDLRAFLDYFLGSKSKREKEKGISG